MLNRLERAVFGLIDLVLVLLIAGMFFMVFGNVVLRYGFNSGIIVSEELSRIFFVWLTFLGAVTVFRDRQHVGVDALFTACRGPVGSSCRVASRPDHPRLLRRLLLGHLAASPDQRLDDARRSPGSRSSTSTASVSSPRPASALSARAPVQRC